MAETVTLDEYNLLAKNGKVLEDYSGNDISPVTADTSVYIETAAGTETLHSYHKRMEDGKTGVVRLVDGKIPPDYLPSYVDDVVEGYYNAADGKFYSDSAKTTAITGETGKIYVDLGSSEGDIYRYASASSKYVLISDVPAATLRTIAELRSEVAVLTLTGGGTYLAGTDTEQTATVKASSNVTPDSLEILQNDTQIAGGSEAEYTADVVLQPTDMDAPGTITVEAKATYGSTTKSKTVYLYIVNPVYVGAGASASAVMVDGNKQTARTTPSGTYSITASEGDYVWIIVPMGTNGMVVSKATLSGFDFPLEAADTTTVGGYRVYRSKNTYKASTFSIVVSGSQRND